MKKLLAMLLAFVMVLSLCTFPVLADSGDDNPVWYGAGADEYKNNGSGFSVDIVENSTGPYVVGDTINFTVTFTNNTGKNIDTSGGTNLKIHLYNTADNLINENVKPDIQFEPTGNLQYTITSHSENPIGAVGSLDSNSSRELKYKPINKELLMKAGASITITLAYTVKSGDIGKYLKNFIMIYLGGTDSAHAIGRYVQSEFTTVANKDEDVGDLTISNTVSSSDTADNNREFNYTLTLSDKAVNGEFGGMKFENGVAKFTLKHNEQKTATRLVAGTKYTVTESNYDGFEVTNDADTTSKPNGYTATGTIVKNEDHRVTFTNTKIVSPDPPVDFTLTYHLNIDEVTGDPTKKIKDKFADEKNENSATYSLMGFNGNTDVEENLYLDFTDSVSGHSEIKSGKYEQADGKTLYFAGWCTTKAGAENAQKENNYSKIDYPVTKLEDNIRAYMEPRPTHVVKKVDVTSKDLYAVWFEKPGIAGYSMTRENAGFALDSDMKTTDEMKLGDNGKTNSKTLDDANDPDKIHAQKYVVHNDGGHSFDTTKGTGDEVKVTSQRPSDNSGENWNFLTWFNKNANREKGPGNFSSYKDPNTEFIVAPGATYIFGPSETIYSLDAVWGKVSGPEDSSVKYDGKDHTLDVSNILKTEFSKTTINSTESPLGYNAFNAFFADDTVTASGSGLTNNNQYLEYRVAVYSEDDDTSEEVTLGPGQGMPAYKNVGTYVYNITSVLVIKDPTFEGDAGYNKGTVEITVGTVEARMTITPATDGDLVISNTVTGENADTNKAFNYTVELDNKSINGKFGESTFTNGVSRFTLKDGEKKEFVELPAGVKVTVTQEVAEGYTTSYKRSSTTTRLVKTVALEVKPNVAIDSVPGAGTLTIDFTNTRDTGNLSITKKLGAGTTCDPAEEFKFKVNFDDIPDGGFTVNRKTIVGTDKTLDVSVKPDETVVLEGIPVGVTYTVDEDLAATEYIGRVSAGSRTGKIAKGKTDSVTFTNAKLSTLTISKKVDGDSGGGSTSNFNFTVKFSGIAVEATEFEVSYDGKTKTIKNGDDSISVTVAKDASVEISGIPVGVTYEITEDQVKDYESKVTSGSASGTISQAGITVEFTNTYHAPKANEGTLTLKKNVIGNPGTDNFVFKVTFTKSSNPLTGTYGGKTLDASGSAEYEVEPGKPVTITGIPEGTSYSVEEITTGADETKVEIAGDSGDKVENNVAKGTIENEDTDTVTITNMYFTTLTVKKEVKGENEFVELPDASTEFTFKVNFGGVGVSEAGIKSKVGTGSESEFTSGGTVKVKAGESVVFSRVPVGAVYTITEIPNDNAKVSFKIDGEDETEGTTTGEEKLDKKGTEVIFTNLYSEYEKGALTINSQIEGEGKPTGSIMFTYSVDLGTKNFTENIGGVDFKNGVATIEITVHADNGDDEASQQLIEIPVGNVTVKQINHTGNTPDETKYEGDTQTENSATVAINAGNESVVSITNTYNASVSPQPPFPPNNGNNGGNNGSTDGSGDKGDDGYKVPDILDADSHYAYAVGDTSGLILPNNTITRKEIVAILFRLLKEDVRMENWSQESPFTDVPDDAWYSSAVGTLYNLGYLHGTGDGKFRPDRPMTRAEITALVASFFADSQADGELPFDDVDGDAWYADYIRTAFEIGLVEGNGDGTFEPDDTLTRAEAMTAFNKLLDRHPNKDALLEGMIEWPDNMDTSAWYYAQIQEATNSHTCGDKWTGEDGEIYERWDALTKNRDWRGIAWENVPNYEE